MANDGVQGDGDARSIEEPASSAVLVLVVALAGATMAQGGFYAAGRVALAVALVVAAVLALGRRTIAPVQAGVRAAGVGAAAVVTWALVRGVSSGQIAGALATAAVVTGAVLVVLVCRGASVADHEMLVQALLAVAGLVALTGWIGVATHREPWALARGTTWRAASTLTYPNAAAAMLVPAFLLATARLVDRPSARTPGVVATVLLAGLLATQSRGGALALVVGLSSLALLVGARHVARAMAPPGLGALVAVVGLLPGLGLDDRPRPVPAIGALLVGAGLAALPAGRLSERRSGRVGRLAIAGVLVLAFATVVLWRASGPGGLTLPLDRLTARSSDRHGATAAALDVLRRHPFVGVGPGGLRVTWTDSHGIYTTRLVHDEYVQFAAELGVVGVAAATVLVVGVWRLLRRSRAVVPASRWCGSVAGLAALAVHSSLDFLWHIPALPFTAALLVGLAGGAVIDPPTTGPSPEAGSMQTKENP